MGPGYPKTSCTHAGHVLVTMGLLYTFTPVLMSRFYSLFFCGTILISPERPLVLGRHKCPVGVQMFACCSCRCDRRFFCLFCFFRFSCVYVFSELQTWWNPSPAWERHALASKHTRTQGSKGARSFLQNRICIWGWLRNGHGHGPLCLSARSFSGAPPSLICWVLIRPAPLWLYKGSNAVQMWHRSLTPFAHHGMLRIMGNDGYLDAVADISDTSFKSV